MKYELKRKTTLNILLYSLLVILGAAILIFASDEGDIFGSILLLLAGGGFIVNELVRSKDLALIFDENGFQIGDTRYSYSNIERVESHRIKHTRYVRIVVDGEVVYKFDNRYENVKEFVKQLTLSGVDHNLFVG